MMTEAEKKWLEERENRICKFCIHCPGYLDTSPCLDWWADVCVMDTTLEDFRDAAAFETRVAASIAQDAHNCALDEMTAQHREGDKPQGWYILRDARLAVEQEME